MSSAKWRPFCLGLNVLNMVYSRVNHWQATVPCASDIEYVRQQNTHKNGKYYHNEGRVSQYP